MSARSRGTSDRFTDRTLALAAGAGSLLALCALFWPAALRRVFVYADLGNFFVPVRMFLADQLARGVTPLWMPHQFCGFYAHGEGQIGIFHPLRWLAYRFLPVSEAFNLECLAPFPLALVGVALFLRRLALPTSAAIFGGVTFALSAFMTARLAHVNAITVLAHVGWLLLAFDVALRETGRRRAAAWLGVALVTGSQLLVGYPIAIVYCWVLALPYAAWVARERRELGPALAVAGALAAGLCLGAIQLVPTWDHLRASVRAGSTYAFLTENSLHPMNLLTALHPWLFRYRLYQDGVYNPIEQTLYLGPVVPIAALWLIVRWRALGRERALVGGLLALCAVALVLALGSHGGVYGWVAALPLLDVMRAPTRFSVLVVFAGAVLAAIAFAELLRGDPSELRRRQSRWLWSVPAASGLVAAFALLRGDPSWQLASARWIAAGPVAFALAALSFGAAVRGRRAALLGLIALSLADHVVYAATLWWSEPPRRIADFRAGVMQPPADSPGRLATRVDFGSYLAADGRVLYWSSTPFLVHDVRLVTGNAGLAPVRRLDYQLPASLRVAGATLRTSGERFERLSGALPRARLVARAVPSADPRAELEAVDVAAVALVDEPVTLEAGPAGTARIERDLPGAIAIAVDAPTRQLLVVAESFHPGWRVEIDGVATRALRVNGDFIGVVTNPGAHAVELRFTPTSFEVGRWITLAGIAVVLALAAAWLYDSR